MKSLLLKLMVGLVLMLAQQKAWGTGYIYECSVNGAVDFTAFVTLNYDTGFVTTAPAVTIDANVPLGDGQFIMLGGTVTPHDHYPDRF
jgi:hypothetical protein